MSSKALKISYRSFIQNIWNRRKMEKKGGHDGKQMLFNVQGSTFKVKASRRREVIE